MLLFNTHKIDTSIDVSMIGFHRYCCANVSLKTPPHRTMKEMSNYCIVVVVVDDLKKRLSEKNKQKKGNSIDSAR